MIPVSMGRGKPKRNYNFKIAQKALQHYEDKYGKNPGDLLRGRPATHEEQLDEQDAELEDLFDSVVQEIEDRQGHLDRLERAGGATKEQEERFKKEIVDRVGELQKIRELQKRR